MIGLVTCLLLGLPVRSQAAPKAPPAPAAKPLDAEAAERIVRAYDGAESWSLRAMVLLSLGSDFPPLAAGIVVKALRDKDERLPPYAIELLRKMEPRAATLVAVPELVAELIERTSQSKHKLLRERALEVLARLLPGVPAKDRGEWRAWWTATAKGYVPAAWVPPPAPDPGDRRRTGGTLFVERAFDLRDAGLDVAIVIDSTGSMQAAIDTARDAVEDVVTLLQNLAPKLRLGLVEYKDFGDLGKGAQLLVPLTKGEEAVHDRLARLVAGGGGDQPERVEKGIELALGDDMHWNKEANRLILVIGDAPPHPESLAPLLEVVKRAHDEPFARVAAPRTGRKVDPTPPRPFITSTIWTDKAAKPAFDDIAKAGGGSSVQLELAAAPKPGKPADPRDAAAAAGANPAVRKIVEHIMLLSFGQEHRAQLETFVRVFFEYVDAKN